jgi:TRAP-type C4-dicarboxylate transport system permease small subunit
MNRFSGAVAKLSEWGGIASALCVLGIIVLILAEILVRTFVGRSTFITEEYAGYLLCWFAFLGMAYTLKADGHIRVNIILSRLGDKGKTVFEVFGALIGMATFGYLTVFVFMLFYDSAVTGVRSMHFSETPLFVPQVVAVLGSALMVLQFGSLIGEKLGTLRRAEKDGALKNG